MLENKCNCGDGNNCNKISEEAINKIKDIIESHKEQEGALIEVLHEVQDYYGYLPFEVQKLISEEMGIALADIYGVVTFYTRFTIEPTGKYRISVCLGTACYVKGSQKIYDKIKEKLNIKEGEVTPDGKFSLDAARCVGACGLAPVMLVNEDVYGKVTADMIDEILGKYE
ncbi:MAG TPA: NADH-quinone oxidoreductase subunit NuoE [Clostridiales bacterium]|nr:MAG: NADH dehydrogenase [Clostridiales bacterium GWD2_32_19]HCC06981.1 NADH-quinone oxidoreductase subunit NuoE [Clostridiales bacterium]